MDDALLQELEESLWKQGTRYDREYMDHVLAPEFFEFGRSGRVYAREHTLAAPLYEFSALLPLPEFRVRYVTPDVALVTYVSEVRYEEGMERANRSSLWKRAGEIWQLCFHQGTPLLVPQRIDDIEIRGSAGGQVAEDNAGRG